MKRRKSPTYKKSKEKRKVLMLRLPQEFYFCSKRNRIFKNKKKDNLSKRIKIDTNNYEGDD